MQKYIATFIETGNLFENLIEDMYCPCPKVGPICVCNVDN